MTFTVVCNVPNIQLFYILLASRVLESDLESRRTEQCIATTEHIFMNRSNILTRKSRQCNDQAGQT
jgi:hypothetical protein